MPGSGFASKRHVIHIKTYGLRVKFRGRPIKVVVLMINLRADGTNRPIFHRLPFLADLQECVNERPLFYTRIFMLPY